MVTLHSSQADDTNEDTTARKIQLQQYAKNLVLSKGDATVRESSLASVSPLTSLAVHESAGL